MLSINLLPKSAQDDLKAIILRRALTMAGLGALAVLALAAAGLSMMRFSLLAELGRTDAALQRVFSSPDVKLVLTADNASRRFNVLLKRIGDLNSASIRWSETVRVLANAAPAGIRLTSIDIDTAKSRMTVQGTAMTRAAVLAYQDALSADRRFSKIESPLTNLAADTEVNFTFTISLP